MLPATAPRGHFCFVLDTECTLTRGCGHNLIFSPLSLSVPGSVLSLQVIDELDGFAGAEYSSRASGQTALRKQASKRAVYCQCAVCVSGSAKWVWNWKRSSVLPPRWKFTHRPGIGAVICVAATYCDYTCLLWDIVACSCLKTTENATNLLTRREQHSQCF